MATELYYYDYYTSNGMITKKLGTMDSTPSTFLNLNLAVGETWILSNYTISADLNYYPSGILSARPLFSTVGSWDTLTISANGISAATFGSSLPNPTTTTVIVPPAKGIVPPVVSTVTTGTFSLTTLIPGTYTVMFESIPYQTLTTTITAT